MQYDLVNAGPPSPEENNQRLRSVRTTVILWLIPLALLLMFIPLFLALRWVQSDVDRLAGNLEHVQSQTAAALLPSSESNELQAEIVRVQELASALEDVAIPPTFVWPEIIRAVQGYDRTRMSLLTLTQTPARIRITGLATDNAVVVDYSTMLHDTRLFSDVTIQNITFAPPAPTGTDAGNEAADEPTAADPPVEFVLDLVPEVNSP